MERNDSNTTIVELKGLIAEAKRPDFLSLRMQKIAEQAKVLHKFLLYHKFESFNNLFFKPDDFHLLKQYFSGVLTQALLLSAELELDFASLVSHTWNKNNAKENPNRIQDFKKPKQLPWEQDRADYPGGLLTDNITMLQLRSFNYDNAVLNGYFSSHTPIFLGQAIGGEVSELERHFVHALTKNLIQTSDPLKFKENVASMGFEFNNEMKLELGDTIIYGLNFVNAATVDLTQAILENNVILKGE